MSQSCHASYKFKLRRPLWKEWMNSNVTLYYTDSSPNYCLLNKNTCCFLRFDMMSSGIMDSIFMPCIFHRDSFYFPFSVEYPTFYIISTSLPWPISIPSFIAYASSPSFYLDIINHTSLFPDCQSY